MPKIHKLEDVSHFQRMHDRWINANSRALELLKAGEGDVSVIYRGLCNETLELGCIALILGKGDGVAQAHFRKAADYALDWLGAPGGTSSPRVYDVNVEVSERAPQITSVHERKPTRAPRKLSITAYTEILSAVVAFGDGAGMKDVAAFPEEGYHNPEEVVDPYFFIYMRAWRAWLQGDERGATQHALACLKSGDKSWPNANLSALVALSTKDPAAFQRGLQGGLEAHKKQYQRLPGDPRGFVSIGGMSLCRLAFDRGLAIEDQSYLPVRLLSNYRGAAVH